MHPAPSLALPPARVVLAEDDASLRSLLGQALAREGYEVIQAATGNELVDAVRGLVAGGQRVDLIVSDVRMPKMTGLVVLRLLRDAELDMPVILITAFGDEATRREAAEHGAMVIDKPVRLRDLRLAVRAALGGSPA